MAIGVPKSVYQNLASIDTSDLTEKKGRFTYLSWTHAWNKVKANYQNATFEKKVFVDNQNNTLPFMRDTKGNTFVEVSVTIEDITLSEIYPVTDNVNKSVQFPDAFQVNTALQRALAKCLAYHGLGINIYAGEDLPVDVSNQEEHRIADEKSSELIKKINTVKTIKALESIGNDIKKFDFPPFFKTKLKSAYANKKRLLGENKAQNL